MSTLNITNEKTRCSEQALACAVILQALMDLGSRAKHKEAEQAKHDAKEWIFGNSRNLHMVCDMADIHPWAIKRAGQKILDEGGLNWRAPAGKGKRYWERRNYRERVKAIAFG